MTKTITRGFLYHHVAAELRRRIKQGKYKPGTAISSESALVKAFGVSAITVRRAIMELMFEGLLYGRQGLGVFVADTRRIERVLSGDVSVSMADDIRRAGLKPSIREISFASISARKELARWLSLRPRTRVYRHEKLVLADGMPISLDTTFLPQPLADRLREQLGHEFMFPLLRKSDIQVKHADFRFESMAASEEQAVMLNLASRLPLIVVHYILFDGDGTPILAGNTVSRADRMVFDLCTWPDRHPLSHGKDGNSQPVFSVLSPKRHRRE